MPIKNMKALKAIEATSFTFLFFLLLTGLLNVLGLNPETLLLPSKVNDGTNCLNNVNAAVKECTKSITQTPEEQGLLVCGWKGLEIIYCENPPFPIMLSGGMNKYG